MFTTWDDLYDLLCALVTTVTGRPAWSKSGIQAAPNAPYATVYMLKDDSPVYDVVQEVEIVGAVGTEPTIQEVVWGAAQIEVEIEFFKDTTGSSALVDAYRFKNGLHRDARNYDLWKVVGLSGPIDVVDMSAIFRADTENRAKVMFKVNANIIDPAVPVEASIYEIDSQTITVKTDETTISTTINAPIS